MPEDLGDDDWVTQYGTFGAPFRNCPRPGVETDVSLLRGRLTGAEAASIVRRRRYVASERDLARYTTVGRLRAAGFHVVATPTVRSSRHVSAELPGVALWEDDDRTRFDGCFES